MTTDAIKYARIDMIQNGFRTETEVAQMTDRQVASLLPAFDDWIMSLVE